MWSAVATARIPRASACVAWSGCATTRAKIMIVGARGGCEVGNAIYATVRRQAELRPTMASGSVTSPAEKGEEESGKEKVLPTEASQ